jgi:hypothetical protein
MEGYPTYNQRRTQIITHNTQKQNDQQICTLPDRIFYSGMLHNYLPDIMPPTQSPHALSPDLNPKQVVFAVIPNYKLQGYNMFTQSG